MLNPFGQECRFFYGDYYRGRQHEECRLLDVHNLRWQPYLCKKCPIPEILQANACEHMQFHPRLFRPFLIMRPQVEITVTCNKCQCDVEEPRIGCGQCHPMLDVFVVGTNENDAVD